MKLWQSELAVDYNLFIRPVFKMLKQTEILFEVVSPKKTEGNKHGGLS